MYHFFKILCISCLVHAAYYSFVNNYLLATYFAVMGFYSDWLAEKEK